MLSEIRAYEEGVLIAEQIPTKLAPDAIKNTNLKIMHRVVAIDDREVMGGTMNLDERQLRVIAALQPGQAAAYAEGADSPYLIQIPRQPEKDAATRKKVTDAEVATLMQGVRAGELYEPVPGYARFLPLPPEKLAEVRDLAQEVVEHPEFTEQFARYFLSLVLAPRQAVYGFNGLWEFIRRAAHVPQPLEKQVAVAVLLHALDHLLETRGRWYRWFYNVSSALREQLAGPLVEVVQQYENNAETLDRLAVRAEQALHPFLDAYRDRTDYKGSPGPFAGCVACPARCLYRWDVAPLRADKTLERDFVRAIQNTKDDQAMWKQLTAVARTAAGRVVSVPGDATNFGVAVCYVAQITAGLSFSALSQRKAAQNVQKLMNL
jgi:hypothetical protein